MVKEHQMIKNNVRKKKDYKKDEKFFEKAFNWKNNLTRKMNVSR